MYLGSKPMGFNISSIQSNWSLDCSSTGLWGKEILATDHSIEWSNYDIVFATTVFCTQQTIYCFGSSETFCHSEELNLHVSFPCKFLTTNEVVIFVSLLV